MTKRQMQGWKGLEVEGHTKLVMFEFRDGKY
jgi:hypothetical protein